MLEAKTEQELDAIRAGGEILAGILGELQAIVAPGVTTAELEAHALRRIEEVGGKPAFKGYGGSKDTPPFPTALCCSVNSEVVHGFALPAKELKDGDLISIDCGLQYRGCFTDMAVTVGVGNISEEALNLCRVTREALMLGVKQIRDGAWISDIGKAVDRHVRRAGYATVKDLVGHGVGREVHEEPQIPNFLDRRLPPVRLFRGLVLAIEPMVNLGGEDVDWLDDQWTVVTADGSLSAHYEVTVIVGDTGPEIVTPQPKFFAEL
jgi:methionyl aminopeptidase